MTAGLGAKLCIHASYPPSTTTTDNTCHLHWLTQIADMFAQGRHTGSQLINDIALDAYCLDLMEHDFLSQGVCLSCRVVLCRM